MNSIISIMSRSSSSHKNVHKTRRDEKYLKMNVQIKDMMVTKKKQIKYDSTQTILV